MIIPVIFRLSLDGGALYDVKTTAEVNEISDGEEMHVCIEAGTINKVLIVTGYQVIYEGEIIAARKMLLTKFVFSSGMEWELTARVTYHCN